MVFSGWPSGSPPQLLMEDQVADRFSIDAAWLDALDNYVENLAADSMEAASSAAQFLTDAVIDKARSRPEWVNMADNIETWSDDGRLVIGVRDREMVSSAFAIEYGDETRPPRPLFRTLNDDARRARQHMQRELMARRGVSVIKGLR